MVELSRETAALPATRGQLVDLLHCVMGMIQKSRTSSPAATGGASLQRLESQLAAYVKTETLEDYIQLMIADMQGVQARLKLLEEKTRSPAAGVKDSQGLEARVAKLESRPLVRYHGVWSPDTEYQRGDLVTSGGSMWHCWHTTRAKPGESDDWQLCVKRGSPGKDAR